MQAVNLELAANLAAGRGYVNAISAPPENLQDNGGHPLALAEIPHDHGSAAAPIEYYLPGYPALISPIVAIEGPSYESAQALNAVIDGVFGPLLIYALLAAFGLRGAGLLAAGFYAIASPLQLQSTLVLPDAFSPILALAPAVALSQAIRRRKPAVWLLGCGVLIGVGAWFRGEVIALVPVLGAVAAVCLRGRQRSLAVFVVVGWLIPASALAVFWHGEYGYWTWSRPGIGVRLWEGMGHIDNPWGARESDEALASFLEANGYQYGTGPGDAFVAKAAVAHFQEDPRFAVRMILDRAGRVLSAGFLDYRPFDVPWAAEIPGALKVAGTLTFMVAVPFGLLRAFRVHAGLGLVILGLWIARAVPFAVLHEDRRDLVPLLVPYLACVSLVAVSYGNQLATRLARLRTDHASPRDSRMMQPHFPSPNAMTGHGPHG